MCLFTAQEKSKYTMKTRGAYAHQTVLGHPGGFLALVALARRAAHVEEAERRGAAAAVALAVRFEHGVEARERVLVAHAADLVEGDPARFPRRDGDGPDG